MNFITFILLRNLQSKWKSNEDISSQYFIVPPLEIYCFVCTNVFEKPQFSSVQFSRSVVSDFLLGLEHARLPCPSSTPRVCSNSCLWSQWYHPTISSSVIPFSFCLQSFPTPGSFPISQFLISWPKYWSFVFSISPSNGYSGLISFRIDWLALLALQGTLKSPLQHHSSKALKDCG